MVNVPKNIQELVSYKPGKPIKSIKEALNLQETAILWNNENNLGATSKIAEAVHNTINQLHLYPDPSAQKLCEALAHFHGRKTEEITVDNGSESILDCMFRAFFDTGDELLTCEGTFVAIYIWAKANRVPVNKVKLGRGFRFDIHGILNAITHKTKAIYIANPNNPTGTIITKKELELLIKQVPEHIIIIVDEAYFEYARVLSPEYPDSSSITAPNVVCLRTFSKAYGLAGMRLGYAVGNELLIEAIRKVRMTFAPSNIAQAAAFAALHDQEHVAQVIKLNNEALKAFSLVLHEAGLHYVPSYGNFIMIDLNSEESANQFTHQLLEQGVFIRQLKAFGLPQCVRVSTGLPKENLLFINVIQRLFVDNKHPS